MKNNARFYFLLTFCLQKQLFRFSKTLQKQHKQRLKINLVPVAGLEPAQPNNCAKMFKSLSNTHNEA